MISLQPGEIHQYR